MHSPLVLQVVIAAHPEQVAIDRVDFAADCKSFMDDRQDLG